jgi:hypothetical protein
MDRSALLKLIHKDLNELQLLLEGMEGYSDIPEPIIKLAKSKAEQLKENIDTLPGEVRIAIHETFDAEKEDVINDASMQVVLEDEVKPEPEINGVTEEKDSELTPEPDEEKVVDPEIPVQPEIVDEPVKEPDVKEQEPVIEMEEKVSKVEGESEGESKVVTAKKKTVTVLGETIEAGEKVIDRIKKDISGSISARLEGSSISDLKRALNINDRFMFQKELFNNDRELFFKSLDDLNSMNSFDSALEYMVQHFEWDFDEEITQRFVSLVMRRYK